MSLARVQPDPAGAAVAASIVDVSRVYGKGDGAVTALDGVSLEVDDGDFVALMGPSGSGKSTLLHLIGALDKPTTGRIEVGGKDISRLSPKQAARYRRREIGIIYQNFNLLPRLSALENVALPLMFEGVAIGKRLERARQILEELGMSARLKHPPATLSGGERQRVAIARALINDPRILLADEPTGNLDSKNAEAVIELLRQLNRDRGQTIVLITHDNEVARGAGRVVTMRDGRITGTKEN